MLIFLKSARVLNSILLVLTI
jgi:hypothetical protein